MAELRYLFPAARGLVEGEIGNFGDYVIQYATLHLLSHFLPPPSGWCDPYRGIYPDGEYDCVLMPGITHLTRGGQGDALLSQPPRIPTYCLAGSLWQAIPKPGVLIRTRVVGQRTSSTIDTSIASLMTAPIGARDPFTHTSLRSQGITSVYTGCPTLFLPPGSLNDAGYLIFSIGRGHYREQTRWARKLARNHPVIGLLHEQSNEPVVKACGWNLPLARLTGDIDHYLSFLRNASMVVSGRLHGLLPSIAFSKPVFYFGTRDTRTGLLDDLGITIHGYQAKRHCLSRVTSAFNPSTLVRYWRAWHALLKSIAAACGVDEPLFVQPQQARAWLTDAWQHSIEAAVRMSTGDKLD